MFLNKNSRAKARDTGLGLSLSCDMIMAHGEELTVKTKEGEGTIFTTTV